MENFNIDELFFTYQKNDQAGLINRIKQVCNQKKEDLDFGLNGKSQNLTYLLLYEYASSIEKISGGKLTAEFVVDKLLDNMKILRYGDFRAGADNDIKYNLQSVTSDEYKEQCRVNSNFGAHEVDVIDGDKTRCAIVLFDNKQKYIDKNGRNHTLSGIDLNDLDDIRHTIFHEWTHIMEKSYVKASELKREDILLEQGDVIYINSYLSPDLHMQDYKSFIENVDDLLNSDKEVLFGGISTIEINEKKSPNRRIMHNQISEGCTEYIAKLVMQNLGIQIKDESRYSDQVEFARKVFEVNGLENSITDYFTSSNKIISFIENNKIDKKDLLHYADDLTTFLGRFETICRREIIKSGNNPNAMDTLKEKIVDFWNFGKVEEIDEYSEALTKEILGEKYEEPEMFKVFLSRALRYTTEKKNFDEILENGLGNKKEIFTRSVKVVAKENSVDDIQNTVSEISSLIIDNKEKNTKSNKDSEISDNI